MVGRGVSAFDALGTVSAFKRARRLDRRFGRTRRDGVWLYGNCQFTGHRLYAWPTGRMRAVRGPMLFQMGSDCVGIAARLRYDRCDC